MRKILLTTGILSLALAVGAPAAEREEVQTSLLSTASALTSRQPVKSRITLSSLSRVAASGRVSTKQAACRVGRKVRLIVEPQGGGGERPGGPPAAIPVASTTTHKNGSWSISAQLEPGRTYFAEVNSKVVGKYGCRYAQSADVLLAPPGGPPLAAG